MRTNLRDSVKPEMLAPGTKAKIIARNTFQFTAPNGDKITRLHQTDVVRVTPKGKTILNSGGWKTVTTKDRMNCGPVHVWSDRGKWMVGNRNGGAVPFYDGIVLPDAFDKPALQKRGAAAAERERKLKKQIKAFLCETLPAGSKTVPAPSAGDCWICLMFDHAQIKKALEKSKGGAMWTANEFDAHGDTGHLLEHVREKYMHGALIRNAAMWRKGERWENCVRYWGVDRLRNVVRDYLNTRLGLAR